MNLIDLIADIPHLHPTDTVGKALRWMDEFHLRHLPVVEEDRLVGLVDEHDLLDTTNTELPVGEFLSFRPVAALRSGGHIFDALKTMADGNLTALPVVDEKQRYLGAITLERLVAFFAGKAAFTQPGGVIILEMNPRDYSLAVIARVIESEKTHILGSFVSSPYGSERLELTLKLDRLDCMHVIATLERLGYTVKASFEESDYSSLLKDRFDLLMTYLSV